MKERKGEDLDCFTSLEGVPLRETVVILADELIQLAFYDGKHWYDQYGFCISENEDFDFSWWAHLP